MLFHSRRGVKNSSRGKVYAGKPDRERERHGTFLIFKVVPFELPLVVASSRFLEQPCSIAYLWFL